MKSATKNSRPRGRRLGLGLLGWLLGVGLVSAEPLTPEALKALQAGGTPLQLIDIDLPEQRAMATWPASMFRSGTQFVTYTWRSVTQEAADVAAPLAAAGLPAAPLAGTPAQWIVAGVQLPTPRPPVSGLSVAGLKQALAEGRVPLVVDLRYPEQFAAKHLDQAVQIQPHEIAEKLGTIAKDRWIVVYDETVQAAPHVAERLRDLGFGYATYLEGGWLAWEGAPAP